MLFFRPVATAGRVMEAEMIVVEAEGRNMLFCLVQCDRVVSLAGGLSQMFAEGGRHFDMERSKDVPYQGLVL